jgi:ligand-binding sensor domain-containing protein/AraC-like DNA-binding protein
MKTVKSLLCLFTVWILLPLTAVAAGKQFANVAVDGGAAVYAIGQDRHGMVWIGTDRGLYSYDGYRAVERFTRASEHNVRIYSLCIEGDRIYLGTDNGVLIYDIRQGRYASSPKQKLTEVRSIAVWQGGVWLGSADGLHRLEPSTLAMKAVGKGLHNVYSLLPEGSRLLVGTIRGLNTVGGNGKTATVEMPGGRQTLVNALCADTANRCVWVGTEGAMYRLEGSRLTPVTVLQGNSVKSFAVNGQSVYVGTDNGLYSYSPATHTVSHATHDSRDSRSIANNIVWTLLSGRWGNIWAGTDQGLSTLITHRPVTETPLADITGNGDGNCLHAIYRHADGSLWMGGTNGLIACTAGASPTDGAVKATAWYRFNSKAFPLSHNRVRRIANDADGRLLVCTDHGINIYNPTTRQFRNVIVTDPSGRYTTAWAYDIVDDRQGRYWIASYMGGVFVIAKRRLLEAEGTVAADRHLLRQLQGVHVRQLVRDGKGRIWASLHDSGLDCIDPRTMQVSHITGANERVDYMVADGKGRVWAAVDNAVRCFGTDGKSCREVQLAGSESGGVSLLAEVEGDIWAFRGRQCTVIGSDGTVSSFAVKAFAPLAMYYDRPAHSVLLGGNDCLASVPVASAGAARMKHPIMLSAVEVDGKVLVADGGSASFTGGITLGSQQNNLDFLFTDMPMQGVPACLYAYMLDGVDRTWQYMDAAEMRVGYKSLPPGRYKLRVRVVGGNVDAAEDVFTLGVRILPPWYLSLWMKLVYCLFAAALLWWAVKFSLMRRRLRREREARERILRQSEARQAFFDNLSRRLKEPLGRIFSTVLAMLHRTDDAEESARLDYVRRDVVAINRLVGECLDSPLANAVLPGQAEKAHVEIVDFCRRLAGDARSGYGRKASFDFHTDVLTAYVDTDITRLQAVLERMLAFAATQTECDEGQETAVEPVVMSVDAAGDGISVSVTVPRVSLAEQDVPFVFNRYLSAEGGNGVQVSGALADVKDFADTEGAAVTASLSGQQLIIKLSFAGAQRPVRQSSTTETAATEGSSPEPESADARLLAKVTAAIEQNIADSEFNVTRLQETLGLGSKLLYRKVKQITGKTPVEFIRHIRMQHAASLLRKGKFTVSEVMYMVGYSNSSYFSKCFQKTYGITPADYARNSLNRLE